MIHLCHNLKKMIKIVKQYFTLDEVTFIAFYPWPLFKLQFLYGKKVHIQQLVEHTHMFIVKWAYSHRFGLDAEYDVLTPEIVEKFHKKGLEINCWTVDDNVTLEKMEALGVDYITTNAFDQNNKTKEA